MLANWPKSHSSYSVTKIHHYNLFRSSKPKPGNSRPRKSVWEGDNNADNVLDDDDDYGVVEDSNRGPKDLVSSRFPGPVYGESGAETGPTICD